MPRALSIAVALLSLLSAVAAPLPWHAGITLVALGGWLALRPPAAALHATIAGAVAAAYAWVPGPGGVVLGAAGVLAAARALQERARPSPARVVGLAAAGTGVALALKQGSVAGVLPAAATVIPPLLATTTLAGCAAIAARGGRIEGLGTLLAGAVTVARVAHAWSLDGPARVGALDAHRALPLLRAVEAPPADLATRAEMLRALPGDDALALSIGWEDALDLGWRPQRAAGVEVEVAVELERRGRGGEGLRLLARRPREGPTDAWMALFERTQGLPVRWGGAVLGPTLPAEFPWPVEAIDEGHWSTVFTASRALGAVSVELAGIAFSGPPVPRLRLDANPWIACPADGETRCPLGPAAAGPHRVEVAYAEDPGGPERHRSVSVRRVLGDAAP